MPPMEPRIAPRRAVEERGALSRGRIWWWFRGVTVVVVGAKSKAGVWLASRFVRAERMNWERDWVRRGNRLLSRVSMTAGFSMLPSGVS